MGFYDDASGLTRYDSGVLFYDSFAPVAGERKRMKITLNLSKKKILECITLGRLVVQKMTGNAKFTTPDPALADITAAATAAETANTAYESSKDTTAQLLLVRNQKWDALNQLITFEAGYVERHSDTEADVVSAGFTPRVTGPGTPPGQVHNLSLSAGDNDATLDAHWDPEPNHKGFELEFSADPVTPSSWQGRRFVSTSSTTLTGLTSGSRIWVRVRALGSNSFTAPWSDAISKIVP
jgi:hypothetical protein